MRTSAFGFCTLAVLSTIDAAPYIESEVPWNINLNKTARDPLHYYAEWPGHVYHPSPDNWRFPFYSMFLDRWVDGDPTNNEANGTVWEFDIHETQFRAGGDVAGFVKSLDYLQSMGIRGIYIIGTIFQALPWSYDGYAAEDYTLLSKHTGTIQEWRMAIDAIHARGMYLLLDMTVATMSDFLGFISFDGKSWLNTSTPFDTKGYHTIWKNSIRQNQAYLDFSPSNKTVPCEGTPVFYTQEGVVDDTATPITCFDGDFDQYGDVEAFGDHPQWQRQLAKFASVQDRLMDWKPSVAKKLENLGCILIDALDVDGFRLDKATQMTAPFLGDWADAIRTCAKARGKKNFFIPGEITGGNQFASTFLGRGRSPDMYPKNVSYALSTTKTIGGYLRKDSKSALDSTAWHYSAYRWLEHHLGIPGEVSLAWDIDYVSLTNAVNEIFRTNDMVNANTGEIDPRHFYGVTNQDVFRWPSVVDGRVKFYLALAITHLLFPGIPLLLWGEEQDMKLLDNTAVNYIFGRQPMMSTTAWQNHGCYALGSKQYLQNVSFVPASQACHDDTSSLDSMNPASAARNLVKQLHYLRSQYRTLQDGYTVQVNGNYSIDKVTYPNKQVWHRALWSVMRRPDINYQDFGSAEGNQTIWFVYSNKPYRHKFDNWDCMQATSWQAPYPQLLSPFDSTVTVRNLFYPYEQLRLSTSRVAYFNDRKAPFFGCLPSIEMEAFSMKAFVDTKYFKYPLPVVVSISPSHDQRFLAASRGPHVLPFVLRFSTIMDCAQIKSKLSISSSTFHKETAKFGVLACSRVTNAPENDPSWIAPKAVWQISGQIVNIYDGIHSINLEGNYKGLITQVTSYNGTEKFLFRIGQKDNPMVFPSTANYSATLLQSVNHDVMKIKHNAAGATKFRYSTDWQATWSQWLPFDVDVTTATILPWKGRRTQRWKGTHLVCQYWSEMVNSAHHVQHGDSENSQRRWPHLYAQGVMNHFLYDMNVHSDFVYQNFTGERNYTWTYEFMAEWPQNISLNIWGTDPGDVPDKQFIYGDLDRDFVLDRVPPSLVQSDNVITFNHSPPAPYLSYQLQVNDITHRYWYVPKGRRWISAILYLWFAIVPIALGLATMLLYAGAFNRVNWNRMGVKPDRRGWFRLGNMAAPEVAAADVGSSTSAALAVAGGQRRRVLIATLEYDISDLQIKIKIGGLGVMAQLMGSNLRHQDLVWVVPMVGDVDYPMHILKHGEPYEVEIHGSQYGVDVYYHVLENITYVMLSSPVFSKQTKADPYPPRMDDLESAVFYSAWNQCIACTLKRFPIDLYHINDYHGALAPMYLLPKIVPIALSLHNAEFQGLWPLRRAEEKTEVCSLFNIPEDVCSRYVQFGNVFNLLHAGVSYLRIHQQGFGAVGVSDKYGARSLARYPIFWSLKEIGKLPNPDPADLDALETGKKTKKVEIDWEMEKKRKGLKQEAQEWAGLTVDPDAQLLVFVGRWSVQKGIDLIADLAPTLVEDFNVQIIVIGPTVDLHGEFAAEKFSVLVDKYPGKICSKPVFTACPPAIFSGADFALIPSRDEPFGLVAVEFGRKGALGIGCKTGGLGTMPGWWYNMNSASVTHLLSQFENACRTALKSSEKTRALLRARAAKQRFPVAVWVKQLDSLQARCIHLSLKHNKKHKMTQPAMEPVLDAGEDSDPYPGIPLEPVNLESFQRKPSVLRKAGALGIDSSARYQTGDPSHEPTTLRRNVSLGSRRGPRRAEDRLDALEEEESESYETYSEHSFDESDEYYNLQDPDYEQAPAEREFDQYLDHWNSLTSRNTMGSSNSSSGDLAGRADRSQEWDSRPGTPNEMYTDNDGHGYPMDFHEHHVGGSHYASLQNRGMDPPHSAGNSRLALQMSAHPSTYSLGHLQRDTWSMPYSSDIGSRLSVLSMPDLEKDAPQQSHIKKGEVRFTDSDGVAKRSFVESLQKGLNPATSKKQLCIERVLMEAEKDFFNRVKRQQLHGKKRESIELDELDPEEIDPDDRLHGMKKFMSLKLGWPMYSILIALGQVLAANAYQLTLLSGSYYSTHESYIINTIFAGMSIAWWCMYRKYPAYLVLSLPFVLYSAAFLLIGLPHISRLGHTGRSLTVIASYIYSAASASGSLFFSLNFGTEGGIEVKDWVTRACIVQGVQQIWSCAMWFWGSNLSDTTTGIARLYSQGTPLIVAIIVWMLAAMLFLVFLCMLFGLPKYYRQAPGTIPAFYRSLYRRKVIVWFLISQVLTNFWLALPYGRKQIPEHSVYTSNLTESWSYLWSSQHLPPWVLAMLCLFFFVGVWILICMIIKRLAGTHTWAPVIFGLGVIAPRYFAEFWAVSTIGHYLPWAGGPFASALIGRSLWLWLTVLDSVQGAGLGMMLLQTLIRDHVAFALICAQVLGASATIAAKAIGIPFSDYLVSFSSWDLSEGAGPFAKPLFWLCLISQVSIPIGFLFFFRKSQLAF